MPEAGAGRSAARPGMQKSRGRVAANKKISNIPEKVNSKLRIGLLTALQSEGKWFENRFVTGEGEGDVTVTWELPSDVTDASGDVDNNKLASFVRAKTHRVVTACANHLAKAESASPTQQFLQKAALGGTLHDRIGALITLVQQNPILHHSYFTTLLQMALKPSRHENMAAIDALKDLFVETLLPNRKLGLLEVQPIKGFVVAIDCKLHLKAPIGRIAGLWFEDLLKQSFGKFLPGVVLMTHDTLPFYKNKGLKVLYDLLSNRPEQDQALVMGIIDKFGDPEKKTAANASHYLALVLQKNSAMKASVVSRMSDYVVNKLINARDRSARHAERHGLYRISVFLSELEYSRKDKTLPFMLMKIYMRVLEALTYPVEDEPPKKPSATGPKYKNGKRVKTPRRKPKPSSHKPTMLEEDNRVGRAILHGMDRCIRWLSPADLEELKMADQINFLYTLSYSIPSGSTKIVLLSFLHRLNLMLQLPRGRFLRCLYCHLGQEELFRAGNGSSLIVLVRECVLGGGDMSEISANGKAALAIVKRLFQSALSTCSAGLCVAAVQLARDCFAANPELSDVMLKAEEELIGEEQEEMYRDIDTHDESSESEDGKTAKNKQRTDRGPIYSMQNRNPEFCHAECSRFWELELCQVHIHPHVKAAVEAAINAAVNPQSLLKSSDVDNNNIQIRDLMEKSSSASLLNVLAYNFSTNKAQEEEDEEDDDEGVLSKDGGLTKRYTNGTLRDPQEEFVAKYFTDKFLLRRPHRSSKGKRSKMEQEKGDGEDYDSDGEAEGIDDFVDDLIAQEMSGDDDDDDDDDDVGDDDGDDGEDVDPHDEDMKDEGLEDDIGFERKDGGGAELGGDEYGFLDGEYGTDEENEVDDHDDYNTPSTKGKRSGTGISEEDDSYGKKRRKLTKFSKAKGLMDADDFQDIIDFYEVQR
eukprot:GHVN01079677.1.p1 GENE.GHVN01079677.1~~GHVN01079677.1.p1  ORF type:complete len:926 (-),score=148.04 GHVN01079677.1:143-2920(-)